MIVKLKRTIEVKGWKCDGCGREVAPEYENFDGWVDIALMKKPEKAQDPFAAAANEFMRMRSAKATS